MKQQKVDAPVPRRIVDPKIARLRLGYPQRLQRITELLGVIKQQLDRMSQLDLEAFSPPVLDRVLSRLDTEWRAVADVADPTREADEMLATLAALERDVKAVL